MPDSDPLSNALSAYARTLTGRFDISDVLYDLTEKVWEVINVSAAGVSLLQDGMLRHVASLNQTSAAIEHAQEVTQRGPCVDACTTMEIVAVADIRLDPDRWPEVSAAAVASGVIAVAGIPFRDGHRTLGALNLFDSVPRQWSGLDLARARVLADMATSYVVHASQIQAQERTNEQLQKALDNRVVIEQAKGILADHHHVSVQAAFEMLRGHARSNNVTIHSVATAVVDRGFRL